MEEVARFCSSPATASMALALSALTMTDPAGGTSSANRRKECWMSARSLKKSRWSSSTFKITATVGKKLRKLLQYSQDSRMMVSPWPTR